MSNENSLVIHLLDKEYRVACPAGEQDNLLAAARYLDEQMREVRDANVIGLERIAIMTALNMSHELLRARQSVSQDSESKSRPSKTPAGNCKSAASGITLHATRQRQPPHRDKPGTRPGFRFRCQPPFCPVKTDPPPAPLI